MKKIQVRRILSEQNKYMYSYSGHDIDYENNIVIIQDDYYLFYFHLPEYYPFKPPKLKINNKEYISKFINFYCYLKPFIGKYLQLTYNCACCNTILCKWSPGNTLNDIINEFKTYEIEKNNIRNLYIFYRGKHIDNNGKFCDLVIKNICDYCI